MTVWFTALKPAVILSSYEAIREAVIDNQYDFASRPESQIAELFIQGSQGIAMVPKNQIWAAHKKLAAKAIRQIIDSKKLEDQAAAAISITANEIMKNGLKKPILIGPYVTVNIQNWHRFFIFF